MRSRSVFVSCWIFLAASPGISSTQGSSISLDVPFFADTTDQCGPSTLAAVLTFWGHSADPTALKRELYTAKLHGTLPMDLVLGARAHGLKADMARGDLAVLQSELRAGRPVIAMINVGFALVPIDHYVVITGFDDDHQRLTAHSAGAEHKMFSYKSFLRAWEKTDFWMMTARPVSS